MSLVTRRRGADSVFEVHFSKEEGVDSRRMISAAVRSVILEELHEDSWCICWWWDIIGKVWLLYMVGSVFFSRFASVLRCTARILLRDGI